MPTSKKQSNKTEPEATAESKGESKAKAKGPGRPRGRTFKVPDEIVKAMEKTGAALTAKGFKGGEAFAREAVANSAFGHVVAMGDGDADKGVALIVRGAFAAAFAGDEEEGESK